jgi:hypothetical protein
MNAPLPLKISREAAAQAYDDVARVSNEVAGRLAARLAAETQGELLFSPADRGATPPTHPSTRSRPWACSCRAPTTT